MIEYRKISRNSKTKIVKFDIGDDAKLVEYYCNGCYQRWIASR
jgi:hypothetical protein